MANKGMNAQFDAMSNVVSLNIGEAEVMRWSVPYGDEVTNNPTQWRVDKFAAERLGELLQYAERNLAEEQG